MKIVAVIKIIRPVNLLITFFSVIISALISSSINQIDLYVFLIALSVTFSFAAGNVFNDIIDFEIDKINRPERVLPKRLLSLSFAKYLLTSLGLFSLLLSLLVSIEFLIIIFFLNLLLFFYSIHIKKIILISNVTVAFVTSIPLLLGGIVVENIIGSLIPAGFAFFTNFIREIIKDIEDIKGDSSEGVITFPQKVGINKSVYFTSILIILLMLLATFPFVFGIYNAEYFVIIMVFVNPVFVFALKLLFTNRDLFTFKKVSGLLKINMILGLIAILIGAQ